jgi:hypothetical protein
MNFFFKYFALEQQPLFYSNIFQKSQMVLLDTKQIYQLFLPL